MIIDLITFCESVPAAQWQNTPACALRDAFRRTLLFHAQEYLNYYPDVKDSHVDPLTHCLSHGILENRVTTVSQNSFCHSMSDAIIQIYFFAQRKNMYSLALYLLTIYRPILKYYVEDMDIELCNLYLASKMYSEGLEFCNTLEPWFADKQRIAFRKYLFQRQLDDSVFKAKPMQKPKTILVGLGSGLGNCVLSSVIVPKIATFYSEKVDIVLANVPETAWAIFVDSPYVRDVFMVNDLHRSYDMAFLTYSYTRNMPHQSISAKQVYATNEIAGYNDYRYFHESELELLALHFFLGRFLGYSQYVFARVHGQKGKVVGQIL